VHPPFDRLTSRVAAGSTNSTGQNSAVVTAASAHRARPHRAQITDIEAAWNEPQDAKPDGWFVGTPVYIERRGWEQYAFDTRERAQAGHPVAGLDGRRAVRARGRAGDGAVHAESSRRAACQSRHRARQLPTGVNAYRLETAGS
jgi:hypothetical protein